MVPPVAAPDEIVELHDALVATPLDDVETLRRLAWRARMIAAKRPGDLLVVLTAAQALAKSGQREDAVTFARRAFDLRSRDPSLRAEVAILCSRLALMDEAKLTVGEICDVSASYSDPISISNASKIALLDGDIILLYHIYSLALTDTSIIPEEFIDIIRRANLEPVLHGHMEITNRYVKDACCYVKVTIDNVSDGYTALSFHIDYRLDLPFAECLKRFDALGEELRAYYISAGRDDLPYLNVISHSLSPMPAYWIDAT